MSQEILWMLFVCFCGITQASQSNSKIVYVQPEQIHLSLSANTNGMAVTWTTWNETDSIVEYGTSPTQLTKQSNGKSSIFIPGINSTRREIVHLAEMTDLPYDTVVYYHVGSDLGWSQVFSFKTFPETSEWSPRIVLYGDMGNANAQSLPRIQRETEQGLYDMIIHVGDFAYDLFDDDGKVGDEFMRQIEPVATAVPYMTCNGNHEAYNNFSNYQHRFNMPNDPETKNMFFSFNVGPIHFISISTEYYYALTYGKEQAFRQYNWLKEELIKANSAENRKNQPWIFVYGHRPMYCSNSDKDDCTKYNCALRVGIPEYKIPGLEDLLYDYKVDVAVWAHEHDYERFWPIYQTKIMNGSYEHPYTNPKAPVHIITGSAGCSEIHDPFGPIERITAFRSHDYGYTRLTGVNRTHLHFQQVSDDKHGAIIDDFWVIKN